MLSFVQAAAAAAAEVLICRLAEEQLQQFLCLTQPMLLMTDLKDLSAEQLVGHLDSWTQAFDLPLLLHLVLQQQQPIVM